MAKNLKRMQYNKMYMRYRNEKAKILGPLLRNLQRKIKNHEIDDVTRQEYVRFKEIDAKLTCPVKRKMTYEEAASILEWGRHDGKELYICVACGYIHLGARSQEKDIIEHMLYNAERNVYVTG